MRVLTFLTVAATYCLPEPLHAQLREYDVKAACLFNIAKFCDWPAKAFPSPSAPLIIGVLGDDPFGPVLDRIVKGRIVNGRPIVIRRGSDYSDFAEAHVVFIAASERVRASRICAALENENVLCVGDSDETEPFTAIHFSVVEGKTVFSVKLTRAAHAGVHVSSKLLALAKSVRGEAPPAPR